ncbi:MAG: MFS transporter [Chloroflexi bacterium]|nr:MFS transporter [Chloroflexota bacterium]
MSNRPGKTIDGMTGRAVPLGARPLNPGDGDRGEGGEVVLSFCRRNFIWLVLDAAIFFFAVSFVDLTGVMPSLLGHLTHAPVLIGLLGSLQTGAWLLPQLFAARVVSSRGRKKPIVLLTTTVSRASWLILLLALTFFEQIGPAITLVAAYLAVALFMFFDGIASLGWYDLIARAVSPAIRGRLFGAMSLVGGIFATVGGAVVQRVLGNSAWPFPADYRLLVGVALALLIVGIIPLALVVEPPAATALPPEPLISYLRRLPATLRDRPDFRRLVGVQLLVGTSSLAVPFYAPYGILVIGLPEADVGTLVMGVTLGAMLGGVSWGYLGDHGRQGLAVRGMALCGMLGPLLALLLRPAAPGLAGAAILLLAAALFFVGCSIRAGWVAYANYVIELADDAERPVLIGTMNTLSGALAIAPPLGGVLAGWLGYEAAFTAAAVCATLGLGASLRLREVKAVRTPAPVD